MTEDTRRALEIIQPMAKELKIKVTADESIMYMNGQPIGIGCNSTLATTMEALGYMFLEKYPKWRCTEISKDLKEDITRYWISAAALKKIMQSRESKKEEA